MPDTVMLRDISDRERLEAESRSRIEAETASRTKTLMLSYIAHEMGNPLNGMRGFAQLMAADDQHPLPPVQAERLTQILASGNHRWPPLLGSDRLLQPGTARHRSRGRHPGCRDAPARLPQESILRRKMSKS